MKHELASAEERQPQTMIATAISVHKCSVHGETWNVENMLSSYTIPSGYAFNGMANDNHLRATINVCDTLVRLSGAHLFE